MPEAKRFKNRRIGSKMCVKCGMVQGVRRQELHEQRGNAQILLVQQPPLVG